MPAGIAEDFLKAIGSLGKAVGPTLQRAAPGIAQGAVTGASVGGPLGAFIGAGAGLASTLGSKGRPPAPAAPATAAPAPPPATGLPATPAPPALPTGQAAAATLVGLLEHPIVKSLLASQALGADGRQQLPTASGASLPRGAINGLLAQLLANATEGLDESESISEQSYLQGESGEYLIDPASPEQQAAVVLSHLQSGAAGFQPPSGEFVEAVGWMPEESDGSESEEWLESDESTEMVEFY